MTSPIQLSDPAFVLVRPQMGENIGAAARAMLNFGLDRMRLVSPRDGWPNPAAAAMASGAGRVLDGAGVFPDLPAALADCHYVFATTARVRGLHKPVLTPEEAMARARDMMAAGQRVAVVFGPERAGLENDDVAHANALVTVPVNPDFPSINLAQCVLLMGYEWRRQAAGGGVADGAGDGGRGGAAIPDPASGGEVSRLADHYEDELERAGFFFPPEKAAGMKQKLRNMWTRLALTRAEVQILHGMLRQIVRRKGGGGN